MTAVMVTHDIEGALAASDRIALLHGGRLRFVGSPSEFRQSRDPMALAFADRQVAMEASMHGLERVRP